MTVQIGALVLAAAFVAALVLLMGRFVRRVIVYEYQRGLQYNSGRCTGVLNPGVYWRCPLFTTIALVDVRVRNVSISGQEILSLDGVSLKVSLVVSYFIKDPVVAINKVQDCHASLYAELQVALRCIIGEKGIDDIIAGRQAISKALSEASRPVAEPLGIEVVSVDMKDMMFPGQLKQTFAQVAAARKEGQAALERARGEQAALRSLSNSAKMIEDNPALFQLRILQTMDKSSGNTIVLGAQPGSLLPIRQGMQERKKEGADKNSYEKKDD